MIKTGLYLHIPFCKRKCYYCDFYSCQKSQLVDSYVDECCKEIHSVSERFGNLLIDTIYLGGGTPSLLTLPQLDKIFNSIHKSFTVQSIETTIEVNPSSCELLPYYKRFGIDRISIGIQSCNDAILKKLGRLHTANEGIRALSVASENYDNVSGDIILGVDKDADIKNNIDIISKYCTHISSYLLSVHQNTPLYKMVKEKQIILPDEDCTVNQYNLVTEVCKEKGFYRYETSNYALLGKEGIHNSGYWNMKPYIGIGPSAHSYVHERRYQNKDSLEGYLLGEHSGNGAEIIEREPSVEEEKKETILLSLRTTKGLCISEFNKKFNSDFEKEYQTGIKKMKEYISVNNDRIYILPQYFLVQNTIILSILTD